MAPEDIITRLKPFVSTSYQWPEIPKGWRLEFILHPDHSVEMDLLHPVSATWWSDDNEQLELPILNDGTNLTPKHLILAGVPYMTSFGHAAVSHEPASSHLSVAPKNNQTKA